LKSETMQISMIYHLQRKTWTELGDKVEADPQKTQDRSWSRSSGNLQQGDDLAAIKAKTGELTRSVQEVGGKDIPGSNSKGSTAQQEQAEGQQDAGPQTGMMVTTTIDV